ncbi:MAG TPA: prepilin-type N-terminal cleavage/methylation domain-containing protein [Myxococcaceae bacterium]|jgi:type IV pilus assembly protein PilA
MRTVTRRRGFTFIEMMLVVVMASALTAIALPRYFQAQKRAKRSEIITQLKSLHAGMSSLAAKPVSIHVPGFDPPRGNAHSYHLSDYCTTWEDRSTQWAVQNDFDECIGVDSYAHPGYPSLFTPLQIPAVSWDDNALMNGMGVSAGVFGTDDNWDYLAYAAGDRDENPADYPDTWSIASADALIISLCPNSGAMETLPAGEPLHIFDERDKDCQYQ